MVVQLHWYYGGTGGGTGTLVLSGQYSGVIARDGTGVGNDRYIGIITVVLSVRYYRSGWYRYYTAVQKDYAKDATGYYWYRLYRVQVEQGTGCTAYN